MRLLHSAQQSEGCIQNRHRLSRLIFGLYCALAFIFAFLFFSHLVVLLGFDVDIYDRGMLEAFRNNTKITLFSFVLNCYSSFCVSAGFFIYMTLTYAGVLEVDFYNQRLQNIGSDRDKLLSDELILLINDHARLSEAIRTLDSFFEVNIDRE